MNLTDEQRAQRNRLKTWIETKGIDRQDFADRMGYKKGYIEQILNGKNAISENVEWRLRKYYPELNMDWLMHGNGEMEEPVKMQNAVSMVEEAGVKYSKSSSLEHDMTLVLRYLQYRIDHVEGEMARLVKERAELEEQKQVVEGMIRKMREKE